MRPYLAAAILAVVLALAPVAAGYAPALAQDFSITNQNDLRVEGAVLGPDWIRKLQAWWDLHAYYPREAVAKNESGIVKVHLLIHPDGVVWLFKVVQDSGSKDLDKAALWTFHNMHLEPFPPGTAAPQADVYITLHYVLSNQPAKTPFTVTNAPVKDSAVATTLQRTCTGTAVMGGWGPNSPLGWHRRVAVTFYRKPDGTPWARWEDQGGVLTFVPVVELGMSAQWTAQYTLTKPPYPWFHYAVWPADKNGLSGTVTNGAGLESEGSIDLTCDTKVVPAIKSNGGLETPP